MMSRLNHTASITYYLRFGRRVAAEPARLASGWLLAFTGRESNPLDRTERFRTIS